jgi:hypothetical protein
VSNKRRQLAALVYPERNHIFIWVIRLVIKCSPSIHALQIDGRGRGFINQRLGSENWNFLSSKVGHGWPALLVSTKPGFGSFPGQAFFARMYGVHQSYIVSIVYIPIYLLIYRVTRLGEISPIGRLLSFGSLLKISEVVQILVPLFPTVPVTC